MAFCLLRCTPHSGGRATHFNVALVANPLAIWAAAALLLISSGLAHAQEATSPSRDEKTDTAAPATEESGQAATTPADGGAELPEVVIETEDAAGEPSATDADQPAPQGATQQPVVAPQPVAPPSPDTGEPIASTVESVIFDAPVEGDTLSRGTTGVDGYFASGTSLATKSNTLIMNIPGQVTIITKELAEDQGATWLGQALLYVPGITVQQGEGHRDQITFRGQETTADFFVDGVRDDIQTFRDLYNAETVEVLKGPLAMIFGRGGGGGVINRVTKRADGIPVYEGTVQLGSYSRKRVTADVGQAVTQDFAVRLNAMYEDSDTFRDFSFLERYGINPTVGFKLGDKTTLHMSYEYKVHDQNVDRGGPSINGRPFAYPIETFFGQPFASFTDFDGHIATATFQHKTHFGLQIRNHTFYADYYKLYQNIFPDSAVNGPGPGLVELDGYQSITERQNFVNQTDFAYSFNTHSHVRHTIVAGTEVVVQDNDEFRNLPTFDTPNSGIFSVNVPASSPTTFRSVFYNRPSRRRFTDLNTFSAFFQDQVEITPYFEVIGGVRYVRFDVDLANTIDGFTSDRVDNVWSPRIGAVIKPVDHLHFYLSYSKSFLPQNGDNFGQLTVAAADLEPEEFENYEGGFKWTIAPRLLMQGAIYQLDRQNQRVTVGPDEFAAVGLTRTRGGELEISGYITDDWQAFGGYALTESEILNAGANITRVGNSIESVPLHSFSMWNKYQLSQEWGVGLGVIHQSSWFAAANNAVKVPGYTRFDGAIYYDYDEHWSAQLNVENLFNTEYWISSHNNNNISYGAPTSAYVTLKAKW